MTNADYLAFVDDGGYRRAEPWLADGWAIAQEQGWRAPLYWERREGDWWYMTLSGMRAVDLAAPVCPVSWAAGGLLLMSAPMIPLFMFLVGMGAESAHQRHFRALARMCQG